MNTFTKLDPQLVAEWRKETEQRIEAIRHTPDMEIPEGATVYYVSNNGNDRCDGKTPATAWRTLERVNQITEGKGVIVRFRRGDIFRGQLLPCEGLTYTAYFEKTAGSQFLPKPIIVGSPENGANPDKWTETETKGIWVYDRVFKEDVGALIFNHGEAHGIKYVLEALGEGIVDKGVHSGKCYNKTYNLPFTDYRDLANDLDFWHDDVDEKVYLRSDENPAKRFSSIEFNVRHNIIAVRCNGVTVDNLCIKYGGAHGIGAGTVADLTVRNCEVGWIGGTIQFYRNNNTTRYGNGIEIYGGCDRYTVENCYLYECYDAAITQQFSLTEDEAKNGKVKNQTDVTYRRNVIEYNNYSIEYFLGRVPEDNPSRMENFLIEDNIMWYAGRGLCEQRPDHRQAAHIKGWDHCNRATNYVIRNNLFAYSSEMLVHISSSLLNPDGSDSMPVLKDNIFVQKKDVEFGVDAQNNPKRVYYNGSTLNYMKHADGNTLYFYEQGEVK